MKQALILEIPASNNYYKIALTLLSTVPPYSKLRDRERELAANLIEIYHSYSNLNKDEISVLMFSKQNKDELMKRMGIKSLQVLENLLTSIRKKGVLNGNTLSPQYMINKDRVKRIIFEFNTDGK